jgi:carbamoyltransferase
MEAGPRALGNRSLLADPRNPKIRDILNRKIKHRESFRPFAPSVLAEKADAWFRISKPSLSSDFMLFAYDVHESKRTLVPAVIHVDGTTRIQTVRKDTNPRYYKLIEAFETLTGVPLV